MSVADLRKELLKLQKEFLGGPVGKLKSHEIEHRLSALKAAMAAKADIPEPPPKRAGPPAAREVKTTKVALDEDTEVTKPIAPEGGTVHATAYKKKKPAPAPVPAPVEKPVEKPAEKPAKKPRRVPPTVFLDESAESPAPKAPKKATKPTKSKATAEPKTDLAPEPEAPAPAPVLAEKPVKLPGGCRALPAAELYLQ